MKLNQIEGVKYFPFKSISDKRGNLCKTFSCSWLNLNEFIIAESFFSSSFKGVTRGMHLQWGEFANDRIVTIISGKIFDVLIDLRETSRTYGLINLTEMSSEQVGGLYIPKGVAHGFQALENSITHYVSSKIYNKEFDGGVNIDSLNIEWPIKEKIMSSRDKNLPYFKPKIF